MRPGAASPRALAAAALAVALLCSQSTSPAALLAAADSARASGDEYAAIEGYLALLKANPAWLEPIAGLAECYYSLEEYDQALARVLEAERLSRGSAALKTLEGYVRIGLGQLAEAEALFNAVIKERPRDLKASFGLAELDMARGKPKSAALRYEEALRVSPANEKALLSLAVIRQSEGDLAAADKAIAAALAAHGDDPQAQFFAGYLASLRGDLATAEARARTALALDPRYADARSLLSQALYGLGRYEEVLSLCAERIKASRNDAGAWYLLGLSQAALSRWLDAQRSLSTCLGLAPDDEIARIALEDVLVRGTESESALRAPPAAWRAAKAADWERRGMYDQALSEYRRALRVYPYADAARSAYAALLRKTGSYSRALGELQFLSDRGRADTRQKDELESLSSLLKGSVASMWGRDQYAGKTNPVSVAVFYERAKDELVHPDADRACARYLADMAFQNAPFAVAAEVPPAASFAEAFKAARAGGTDYFAIVNVSETQRDVQVRLDLYVSRTGSRAASWSSFRTGNDRVQGAASRVLALLSAALPTRGTLLERKGDLALVDLGRADGLSKGQKLAVVKKGRSLVKFEGLGIEYSESDRVGSFEAARLDEELSEGNLAKAGFYDTINPGDEVILLREGAPAEAKDPGYPGLLKTIRMIREGSFLP